MSNKQTAEKKSVITISPRAADRIKFLLQKRGKESLGIRIGIKSGGCNGISYVVEYADEAKPFEEIIEKNGVKVLLDPKAIMYIVGTEMDYIDSEFKSGFAFLNPNAKGTCGCKKSFNV